MFHEWKRFPQKAASYCIICGLERTDYESENHAPLKRCRTEKEADIRPGTDLAVDPFSKPS